VVTGLSRGSENHAVAEGKYSFTNYARKIANPPFFQYVTYGPGNILVKEFEICVRGLALFVPTGVIAVTRHGKFLSSVS